MKKLRSRKENNDWLGDTVDDCLNKFKKYLGWYQAQDKLSSGVVWLVVWSHDAHWMFVSG